MLALAAKGDTRVYFPAIPPLRILRCARSCRWPGSRFKGSCSIEAEVVDIPTLVDDAVGKGKVL
jgi:hypothetical protein